MKKICYVTTISMSIKAFFIPQLRFLAEQGYDVTVICSPDPELAELLGEGVRFLPVEIPRGVSFGGSLRAIRALTKVFKEEKFDLVQYSTPNAAFYASIAAKKTKVPVRNYHLMGLRYLGDAGIKRKILYTLDKVACKNSTHVECVSPSNLRLAVEEKLFPAEKGKVVWNGSSGGIDLKRFDVNKREEYRTEIRKKLSIAEDEFVFGFVGRITTDKGVNELLTAFEGIQGARLMMVGPQEENGLNEKSLANESVIYTGAVSDIEKYYCAMDVLVFPSYREGFGNVVMEAGAMGTTSIVSNIPGPIDIVEEGKTALLVPPKNSEELKKIMMKMLEDRELTAELSKNAVEYISQRFDQTILMQRIYENKEMLLKG